MNNGDSKLLANQITLKTTGLDKSISAKRVRCKHGLISSVDGNISIGSYVEGYQLEIKSEKGNIGIGKKLGVT